MCGAKDFMLKKNLFKMVSLFTFVMLFLFNVVAFDCLASNQNGKSPNGYTLVNDFSSSSDEGFSNLAEKNSQTNGANGEKYDDESWHEEEEEEEEVNREEDFGRQRS